MSNNDAISQSADELATFLRAELEPTEHLTIAMIEKARKGVIRTPNGGLTLGLFMTRAMWADLLGKQARDDWKDYYRCVRILRRIQRTSPDSFKRFNQIQRYIRETF